MANLTPKRLVAVIWLDAHGAALGDYSESEIARDFHKPAQYTTFGLLLRQDELGLTLGSEQGESEFRGLSFIPSAMIVEIIDLGIPKRKRKVKDVPPAVLPAPH